MKLIVRAYLHLFVHPIRDGLLGLDLKAIDIQRGRDQGVCFYSQLLRLFGPHNPQSFDDLAKLKIMDPEVCIYCNIKNFELFSFSKFYL